MMEKVVKQKVFKQIAHAYSLLAFSESYAVGCVIIALTLLIPNTGICGLVAITFTLMLNQFFKVSAESQRVMLFNGAMVGLCCGMVYALSLYVILLIFVGCVISTIVGIYLHTQLTEKAYIPIFNAPFAVSSAIIFLAVQSYGTIEATQYSSFPSIAMPLVFECFFRAFGMVILMPHMIFGIAVFVLLIITSRYLALVAISAYVIGFYTFTTLNGLGYSDFMARNGFNLFLPALVLSMFTIPSLSSFALCMVSSVVSSIVIVAFYNYFDSIRMPITTLPFLFTTILILLALKKRHTNAFPVMNAIPTLPRESFENAKFSNGRINELLPHLHLPYFGSWVVYQGFNGKYTHQKNWKYAADFHIVLDGKSYSGDGSKLEDYYSFNKPVTSPVYGTVCFVQNAVEDNTVGKINQAENWGNYVLIQASYHCYVMIAHLKQASVRVNIGEYLAPHSIIGLCGNSGRSPRPHIHIHTQNASHIGSETVPFRFLNVIKNANQFCLSNIPVEGSSLENAQISTELQQAMKMQIGVMKEYSNGTIAEQILTDVDFYGNLSLITKNGAKAFFIQNQSCLSFYARNSVHNEILDSLILACGFVPFAGEMWHDFPQISFFPIGEYCKKIYRQFVIFTKCSSQFRRTRNTSNQWIQEGEHTISIFNLFKTCIKTRCVVGENGIEEITITQTKHGREVVKTIVLQEIKISAK